MGCASSKLDDLPAVALCKDRCTYLDEAIRQRYALAEAHILYMHSLEGIGNSLQAFFEHGYIASSSATVSMPSPVLNLPPKTKGGGGGENSKQKHGGAQSSGPHLDFRDDSDDEDGDDDGSLLHSGISTPLHDMGGQIPYYDSNYGGNMGMDSNMIMGPYSFPDGGGGGGYVGGGGGYVGGGGGYVGGGGYGGGSSSGGSYMHMNYMKNKGTIPSVVYDQRPLNQTVYIGESSSQSSYYNPYNDGGSSNPYGNNNSGTGNPYGYYGYSNYGSGPSGGYNGMPPNYGVSSMGPSRMEVASSSKPPPPPPSPPRPSAWDFLNFFGGDETDKYFPMHIPSKISKDLREEEDMPDLEDEREEIKEVYTAPKVVDAPHYAKSVVVDDDGVGRVDPGAAHHQTGPTESVSSVSDTDEEYVEKKVVDREARSEDHGNSQGLKAFRSVDEVVREIKDQFQRASKAGNEIVAILEVGKFPHRRKHHVASKLTRGAAPSLSIVSQPSTSADPSASGENAAPASQVAEDVGVGLKNLSSTLQKLYLSEKKLYNEVKAEEKMRVIHDRKVQKLKRLDEKGAEPQKVDSTRNSIRSLSTRIKMAIQIVDRISIRITKIRDEELWPQLYDLIQGFARMWKSMLDCHRTQCQVIRDAKSLMPIGSGKKFGDAHLEVMLQFQRELLNWTNRFTNWVSAQKGYVKALNGWLVKCLLYEPEETADGPVPFSPGRMGAPPVFVICNQWSQAMGRISEKEVIESMRVFARSVFQLWERDKGEVRQSMMGSRDSERKVKNFDREDQKIQKEIQALDKRLVVFTGDGDGLSVTGNAVYQSDISSNNLQGSLQHIFEAMEKFTTDSLKAYEELLERTAEETRAQDR